MQYTQTQNFLRKQNIYTQELLLCYHMTLLTGVICQKVSEYEWTQAKLKPMDSYHIMLSQCLKSLLLR